MAGVVAVLMVGGLIGLSQVASKPKSTALALFATAAPAAASASSLASDVQAADPTTTAATDSTPSTTAATGPTTTAAATTPSHPGSAKVTTTTTKAPAPSTTTTTVPPLRVSTTTSSVQWVQTPFHLTYGNMARDYLLIRPTAATPLYRPLPIIVDLAGCCVSSEIEALRTNFMGVAGPAIIVYPDYYEGNWNAGACCGAAAAQHVDDVGFITSIIKTIRATQPGASPGPVFLAGYSNGAKMAMMVACQQPALVAAVAIYGATRTSDCPGPPPMSVLVMAGTKDPQEALQGKPIVEFGFTEPTVQQLVDSYLQVDACHEPQQQLKVGSARNYRWKLCGNGHQVGLVLFDGSNHDFPQTNGATPSGQQVMWDFFADLGA